MNDAFERGGEGAGALAEAVVAAADEPHSFDYVYPLDAPIADKIEAIATRVYGADGVFVLQTARDRIEQFERVGLVTCRSAWPRRTSPCRTTPRSDERPDRLHRHDPRRAGVHRRRLDRRSLRGHADDAGLDREPRGVQRRHRR